VKYKSDSEKIVVINSIKQYLIQKSSKLDKYFKYPSNLTARVTINVLYKSKEESYGII
jgi:hypothetical protein